MAPVTTRRLTPGRRTTGRLEMRTILDRLTALLKRDSGQTMAEYAVVLAVIALGIFAALGFLTGAISGTLDTRRRPRSRSTPFGRGPLCPRLLPARCTTERGAGSAPLSVLAARRILAAWQTSCT